MYYHVDIGLLGAFRIVSRSKIINVMVAVGGLIFINTRVAPPIRCINKCPAVMLAVSRTANAIG